MQGARPSKRITCLGPLMVMESARTFCARGWSFPGWLVVLRELQSSHISTHLQGCFMWLGRCSLGPVLPLSHGSGPGWGWGTGRGGGGGRHRRASLSPSFHLSLGSASPCSWLSWKRDVSVCLSGSPSSDHLASATPTPTVVFFFFFGGAGPCGGRGQAPAHSSPVSEAPGLQACSLQCLCCVFFPPMDGRGVCAGLGDFCLKATPSLSPCAELIACADGAAGRSRPAQGPAWGVLPTPIQCAQPLQCAIVIFV